MILVINGHEREFPELKIDSSLASLVEALGLKGDRVAVERNGSIVSRTDWPTTALQESDKLEVVHFVGGGSFSGRSLPRLAWGNQPTNRCGPGRERNILKLNSKQALQSTDY